MPRRIHLLITIGDVDPENRYRLESENTLIDAIVTVPERAIDDTLTLAAHHALHVLSGDLAAAPNAADKLPLLTELVSRLQNLRDHPLRLTDEQKPDVRATELDGPFDVDTVGDLLELVDEIRPREVIASWHRRDREDVARWARAVHLRASDHDDVEVPPTPSVLRQPEPATAG